MNIHMPSGDDISVTEFLRRGQKKKAFSFLLVYFKYSFTLLPTELPNPNL